jgi:formylglycine-generating enzyme required for sulfatase activity
VTRAGWLLVAALAAGACGDDDGSGSGGPDGGGAGVGECPTDLAGPALVAVASPAGTGYCIDATEVTEAQYQAFLDAAPAIEQPDWCAENATFVPLADSQCDGANDPSRPDHPVSCVDACDAWSYCAWAGKHLCGRVGGGPLADSGDPNDASEGEWFNACSGMGENDYAYGDSWEVETCNAGPEDFETTVPPVEVGSFPDCHGTEPPFDRIFDMSGNVSEWIDACDEGGVAPYCWAAGGGSNSRSLSTCQASVYAPWDDVWWDKGFRCCYGAGDGG